MISRRKQNGFSLLETVLALALIGVSLLIATALLNGLVGSAARVEANATMLRELEAVAEMMRAGVLPLQSGTALMAGAADALPDLTVNALVVPADVPDLYQVTLRARCTVGRHSADKVLVTQVWRP